MDFDGFCFLMDLRKLNARARNAALARRKTAESAGGSRSRPGSARPRSNYSERSGESTPRSEALEEDLGSSGEVSDSAARAGGWRVQ